MSSNQSRNYYKNSERGQHRPKAKSSKDKKLSKLIESASDSDEGSEHELSHYLDDRVKLMKEVLKIIKRPRQIKNMAPECMKNMDLQEVNSMLLEELLGISNKRLKYIFEGKILDEESSTDEDQPSIDVISLDDISEDEFVVISDDETDRRKGKHRRRKIKQEAKDKSKKIKKERPDKEKTKDKLSSQEKETIGEDNLMSVLELLELQARARAIKSQLELENRRKQGEITAQKENGYPIEENDDEEIIMEIPKEVEIIITSSDSENEQVKAGSSKEHQTIPVESISNNDESSQESQNHVITTQVEQETNPEKNDTDKGISEKTIPTSNEEANVSAKSDSESDSDDTLEVVREREQRRKQCKIKNELSRKNNKENGSGDKLEETNENDKTDKTAEVSKIDEAVEEFLKTQPTLPDNEHELQKVEEAQKEKEEQTKTSKNKRLKLFKNKLQSFKQDVAVEVGTGSGSSGINVLENIIITPGKARSHKSLEESDDLVINIDQDDIDCIICD